MPLFEQATERILFLSLVYLHSMMMKGAGLVELGSTVLSLSNSISSIVPLYVHFILKPVDGDDDVIVFA
jgi:hypothetical protein